MSNLQLRSFLSLLIAVAGSVFVPLAQAEDEPALLRSDRNMPKSRILRSAAVPPPPSHEVATPAKAASAVTAPVSKQGKIASAAKPQAVPQVPDAEKKNTQTIERISHSDQSVSINEVRVGGQTQSIEVAPTNKSLRPYSVEPERNEGMAKRDLPKSGRTNRSWKVFDF